LIEVIVPTTTVVAVVEIPVVPWFMTVNIPLPVVVAPTVYKVTSKIALNGTDVPEAAEVTAPVQSKPSAVVPFVPYLKAKVEALPTVEVFIPSNTALIVVPDNNLEAGKAVPFLTKTVSVVLIAADCAVFVLSPLATQLVPFDTRTLPAVPGVAHVSVEAVQLVPSATIIFLAVGEAEFG